MEALTVANDLVAQLGAPDELVSRVVREMAARKTLALSPDKEQGLFLLFMCGDDLEQLHSKTNYPRDIILATALHYKWNERAVNSRLANNTEVSQSIHKDLVNTLLVATIVSVKRQLGDVIAGKIPPTDCPLIPTNLTGLEKLLGMVEKANGLTQAQPAPPTAGQGGTVVQAQNVQIVQQAASDGSPQTIKTDPGRAARLRAARGE